MTVLRSTTDQPPSSPLEALSSNLPQLWNSSPLRVSDKRRVVQLLLEKAVVTGSRHEQMEVELHWMGGTVTRHALTRRVRHWSDLSTYGAILSRLTELESQGQKSSAIADALNAEGYRSCRGREFSSANIRQLRTRAASLRVPG